MNDQTRTGLIAALIVIPASLGALALMLVFAAPRSAPEPGKQPKTPQTAQAPRFEPEPRPTPTTTRPPTKQDSIPDQLPDSTLTQPKRPSRPAPQPVQRPSRPEPQPRYHVRDPEIQRMVARFRKEGLEVIEARHGETDRLVVSIKPLPNAGELRMKIEQGDPVALTGPHGVTVVKQPRGFERPFKATQFMRYHGPFMMYGLPEILDRMEKALAKKTQ